MRTKFTATVTGLLLVVGASMVSAAPANAAPSVPDAPKTPEVVTAPDAAATPDVAATPETVKAPDTAKATSAPLHHGQPESLWYCAAHRPNGYVVIHSWPYALWDGGVGYWCIADFYGRRYQYWVHVQPPGSANSWQPWAYQLCYPAAGWVSYCQGPSGTHGPT